MNAIENMKRKENGIIFDSTVIPNYAGAYNIALFTSQTPNWLKWFTNGGIEIRSIKL